MRSFTEKDICQAIDHSILGVATTRQENEAGVRLGLEYKTASCCVRPCDVAATAAILKDSETTKVCTVIGFPHGYMSTEAKVAESVIAIQDGATELDMVINVSRLRSGEQEDEMYVVDDIAAVVNIAKESNVPVKVILETALLNEEQIVKACKMCEFVGAAYVKTSTGFSTAGSTIPNLLLMRSSVSSKVKVKASGGIRTLDAVIASLCAGASRIGTSSTANIIEEFRKRTADTNGVLTVDEFQILTENGITIIDDTEKKDY